MKNYLNYLIVVALVGVMSGCGGSNNNDSTIDTLNSSSSQIQTKSYHPTKEEIEYSNIFPANSDNWCQVLRDAPSHSTVLLKDGEYQEGCAIKNKSYITIKAENKYGVVYTGDNFFLELQDKNNYINLLNIEVTSSTDKFDSGLLKVAGYATYDNHHIYVADCWIHDSGSGILTSPKNHDITVDRCLIHDIKQGYAWYAMGWHLTLSNSVIFHMENDGMMVRGYFPLNRTWDYEEASNGADVTKESNLEILDEDDWTHYITGNFFGEGYNREAARGWDRGAAIGFYIGRGNNDGDDAYLSPQNVLIENNYFYNLTPSVAPTGDVFEGAIHIDADSGFSRDKGDSIEGLILGTQIKDNFSNVAILKPFYNPDESLIEQSHNKSWDARVLQAEFDRRLEELKKRG